MTPFRTLATVRHHGMDLTDHEFTVPLDHDRPSGELLTIFARAATLLAKAKRFMPGLRTEGGSEWMGFRPSLPDSLPAIGSAAADARVVYAFGHGHLGLTQAAATARLVADIMAGRPVRPPKPTQSSSGPSSGGSSPSPDPAPSANPA